MGRAGFQPGLRHVLQHSQGHFQGWTESHQQRRGSSVAPAAEFYDPGRVGGVSLWQEARHRTNERDALEHIVSEESRARVARDGFAVRYLGAVESGYHSKSSRIETHAFQTRLL